MSVNCKEKAAKAAPKLINKSIIPQWDKNSNALDCIFSLQALKLVLDIKPDGRVMHYDDEIESTVEWAEWLAELSEAQLWID